MPKSIPVKITSATRRTFAMNCAAVGKPITNPAITDIFVASLRAGLNLWQSTQIALMARDADCFSSETISAAGLNDATRMRHAAEHPNGKWAAVIAARPSDWRYLSEQEARAIWNAHVADHYTGERLRRKYIGSGAIGRGL